MSGLRSSAARGVRLALTVMSVSACASRTSALGQGDDVDFCRAYIEMDALAEPRPENRQEVLDYATAVVRIIDRVDPDRDLRVPDDAENTNRKPRVSRTALDDLAIVRAAAVRLREAVKAQPGDGPAIRAATNELADDQARADAGKRLTTYFRTNCKVDG